MRPPSVDLDLGMEAYLRPGRPRTFRIREEPGDFMVDEVMWGLPASAARRRWVGVDRGGLYLYSVLRRGMTTPEAAGRLASGLGIRESAVSYAGLKDKRAVVFQYMAAPAGRPEVRGPRFHASLVGRVESPIARGQNDGNLFSIRVRRLSGAEEVLKEIGLPFPNFFGYQRFGDRKPYNHELGKLIVSGRFGEAAEALAEKAAEGGGGWQEKRLALRLREVPSDPLRALRSLGRTVIRMMVHAYQSYLFNRLLSRRILEGRLEPEEGDVVEIEGGAFRPYPAEGKLTLPIPGFTTRLPPGSASRDLLSLLEEEGISTEDFVVRGLPEAAAPGGYRRVLEEPVSASVRTIGGDLVVRFFLRRGVYATSMIREWLKPVDPLECGLL